MSIRIGAILDNKGHKVFTLRPNATLLEATQHLKDHGVGALVVSDGGTDIAGIISERDIVRCIAHGPDCLDKPVSEVMTTTVTTCTREDTSDHVMSIMTERRMRHVPVVEDGTMVGVVSIGDVVKAYTDELEVSKSALEDYVTGSSY